MPRPRKFAFNKTVLLITTSIEEGILMPANPLVKTIIQSCLARAQELHPVRICHFVVTATHVHKLVVVDNPDNIQGFMCRFKTESAHAINHLLGRAKRTVWCEGYDSPVVGAVPTRTAADRQFGEVRVVASHDPFSVSPPRRIGVPGARGIWGKANIGRTFFVGACPAGLAGAPTAASGAPLQIQTHDLGLIVSFEEREP